MRLFDQDAEARPAPPEPVELEPIPLPTVTSSRRVRRRRRRQQERRFLAGTVTGGLVVAGALVVAVAGIFAGRQVVRQVSGHPAGPVAPPPAPLPVMFVEQTPAHTAGAVVVLAPSSGGRGGSVVLIDPGTMAEAPSLGLEPVGQVLSLSGADRLRTTVANLLGVPIGEVDTFDDAGLVTMLKAGGPYHVDVPEEVDAVQPGGAVTVLFPAGPQDLAAAQIPALLATPGSSGDLARLARQEAFFHAWLTRIRQDGAVVAPAPLGLRSEMTGLAAGVATVRVLPVDSVGKADDGSELYQPRATEIAALVAQVFPTFHPQANRPTVQILNGTGALGLAQRVTDRLLPVGVQVKLTDNADRLNYAKTEVVYYNPADASAAQRIRDALGVGTLVLSRRPLDVVDVTVIVGKDFSGA